MMQRSPTPAALPRFTAAQLAALSLSTRQTRGEIMRVRVDAEMAREHAHARRVATVSDLALLSLFAFVVLIMLGWL